MARAVASLPGGSRVTGYTGRGAIPKFLPPQKAREALAETKRATVRECDLPARVVVYYVIALAPYISSSCREALRRLLEGVQWLMDPFVALTAAGKSGISQARAGLGPEPLKVLYHPLIGLIAEGWTNGA